MMTVSDRNMLRRLGGLRGWRLYAALTVALTAVFCGLLWAAGLGGGWAQRHINEHALSSVKQFKEEGVYPQPFHDNDRSSQLDNWTDSLILQASVTMNTGDDPLTIFSNPYLIREYGDETHHDLILSLEETAQTGETNRSYSYYWQGFRVFVRPLLIIMDYQDIRGLVAIVFMALFAAALLALYRHAGLCLAAPFAVAVAAMNAPVAMSQLQYVPCFFLAFAALCLTPRALRAGVIAPFFFVLGACTQYVDFYTYPLLTLGFPLVFMLALLRDEGAGRRAALMGRCVLAWLSAYGLFWLIRLLLAALFMDPKWFSLAFDRFSTWTGLSGEAQYAEFTPGRAVQLVMDMTMSKRNLLLFCMVLALYACRFAVCALRRQLRRPPLLMLVPAVLPFVWVAAASRATGNHYWFQYRAMAVTVFAVGAFLAQITGSPAPMGGEKE
ncbi:MAG: hypothetical protein J6K32_04050 [Clostridia bacterium]|nr:hypothetical protein [Clostridia bacterium]